MTATQERILLVESDPEISDLIARQALKPLGYQVRVVGDSSKAIQETLRFSPDVIVVDMGMPGLSGKDLLVALSSQGVKIPILVIAEQGMEGDVIQAFRLGASDYLSWPVRETEVVSAVEHALEQTRSQRERERLSRQLEKTNRELQRRVRELTTIFGIGKAVTSVTDQRSLFDKIVDGAVFVTEAEKGWFLVRRDNAKSYVLGACKNMPKSVVAKVGQVWDDGISSLVALSGEPLSIHGAPLKRFKVAQLGQAALVVPVKAQKEVVGLLVVIRDAARAFSPGNQTMLEAVADYASISLMNAQLFQALEKRAVSLQKAVDNSKESETIKAEILRNVSDELRTPLTTLLHQAKILSDSEETMSADQQASVRMIQENLAYMRKVVDTLAGLQKASAPLNLVTINVIDLARQAMDRIDDAAHMNAVTISSDFQRDPLLVGVDPDQIAQVFDALLSNAVRFSSGGKVTTQIGIGSSGMVHIMVQDTGPGIALEEQAHVFHPFYQAAQGAAYAHDGFGIGLALAKDIVKAHGGEMWVKSEPGSGAIFHFTLQPGKGSGGGR